jgi:hypothetical protein
MGAMTVITVAGSVTVVKAGVEQDHLAVAWSRNSNDVHSLSKTGVIHVQPTVRGTEHDSASVEPKRPQWEVSLRPGLKQTSAAIVP